MTESGPLCINESMMRRNARNPPSPIRAPPEVMSADLDRQELISLVGDLKPHRRSGRQSPHKALLLLHALGRLAAGQERLEKFTDAKGPLSVLIRRFGWSPAGTRPKPHYPFTALRTDKLWEVPDGNSLAIGRDGVFSPRELRESGTVGGLPGRVHDRLCGDPELITEVAQLLLHRFFPESWHGEIRTAVGLDEVVAKHRDRVPSHRLWRDPTFRLRVLDAYDARCAVCGQDLRVGNTPLNMEAAHIRPVRDAGPDDTQNGLALCSLHHRAFDRGIIGLREEGQGFRVIVSELILGTSRNSLIDLRNQPVRGPREPVLAPKLTHVLHHRTHYFLGRDGGQPDDSTSPCM